MLQLPRDYAPLSTHPALVGTQTRAFRAKTAIRPDFCSGIAGSDVFSWFLKEESFFCGRRLRQTAGEGGRSERKGGGEGGRSTTVSDLLSSEAVFEPGQIRRNQCKTWVNL